MEFGDKKNLFERSTMRESARNALLVAALVFGGSAAANAGVFGGSAAFTDLTTGNALNVTATPNTYSFTTNNLSVGGSQFFSNFMTLKTTDSQGGLACLFGCTSADQVALTFSWTAPALATSSAGGAVSQTDYLIASFDNGSLIWAGPTFFDLNGFYVEQLVTFSDGAKAYVDLYNTAFSGDATSQTAQVDMRLRNVANPTAVSSAVPEPMTIAVFCVGLIAAGSIRRRKQAQKA
jgi:hypothetical protein